jgi:hypothetical protein
VNSKTTKRATRSGSDLGGHLLEACAGPKPHPHCWADRHRASQLWANSTARRRTC